MNDDARSNQLRNRLNRQDLGREEAHRKLSREIVAAVLSNRRISAALAGAIVFYGAGHAALALIAGLLARSLTSPDGAMPAWMNDVVHTRGLSPVGLISIGLSAALVKAITGAFIGYGEARLSGAVAERFRLEAARAVLASGSSVPAPHVVARLTTGTREIETGVRNGWLATLRAGAQLAPLAVAFLWIGGPLAGMAGGALALFGLAAARVRQRLRNAHGRASRLAEELHTGVDELVRHVDLWRSYDARQGVTQCLARAGQDATLAEARVEGARAALSGANEVLAALALMGAVMVARAIEFPVLDGQLLVFAALFFLSYRPLRDLGDARGHSGRAHAAVDALGAIQAAPAPTRRARTPAWMLSTLELCEFGVGALDQRVSLRATGGTTICICGPTGCGKTSLLRALLGLDASVGRLRYGERDLGSAGVGLAERPFAWVPQDAPLVTGTLMENVIIAGASSEAAQRALEMVGAAPLVASFGNAVIGPGGRPVSGGERRLICLARAFATGAPVLLLDEPTEGLDAEASERVIRAIRSLRSTRTVLLVTHRAEVSDVADVRVRLAAPERRVAAE